MEAMGVKIRRHRRRLGLTLDELAGRTGISKPYLSLIETGRVPNPPSDEKLRRLEQALGFNPSELVTQAHLQRTPRDVRAVLTQLLKAKGERAGTSMAAQFADAAAGGSVNHEAKPEGRPIDLDDAYLSGVLADLVDKTGTNVEMMATNVVPVINKVSAGYPRDFTDMNYPKGIADDYVGCPDVRDKDAFACRVHGDSMTPKYREGDIVIFSPAAAPKNGDDCFVRFEDGQTTFKRVFFESGEGVEGSVIRLQPRNEKYRPQTVAAEKVTGLWKAVYKYQSVEE
jgi:SOS-response transcriptional repressor LexA